MLSYVNEVNKVLFLTGYKSNLIMNRYNKCKKLKIEFSDGKLNWKTGTRIFNSYNKLDNYFLLLLKRYILKEVSYELV